MTLWLKVTKDKYEFPEVFADSIEELAKICGVSVNTIRSSMTHHKTDPRRWKRCKYKRVEIEEDSDDLN